MYALPQPSRSQVLLAGAAGGLAEILWVSVFAALSGTSGLRVAREVTVSVFGPGVGGELAPALGIAIHMALAVAVAAAFAATLWRPVARRYGSLGVMAASLAALATIWTVNFFVVLPAINPAFVALMPLSVTLASKLLFGVAMAAVLDRVPSADMALVNR